MQTPLRFDDHKFRCSSLGILMTKPKSKTEELSETTKSYLIDIYNEVKTGRSKDIKTKYMEKGIIVEDQSIDLLSDIDGQFYAMYEKHRETDEFKTGECDLENEDADTVIDIKSCWDSFTFQKKARYSDEDGETDKINQMNFWQGQGYLDLYGRKNYILAYTLIDTPQHIIDAEIKRFKWELGLREGTVEYATLVAEVEFAMKFGRIPNPEKIIKIAFSRDNDAIKAINTQIPICRQYLNDYAEAEFERIRTNAPIIYVPKRSKEQKVAEVKKTEEDMKAHIEKLGSAAATNFATEMNNILTQTVNDSQVLNAGENMQPTYGDGSKVVQIDLETAIAEVNRQASNTEENDKLILLNISSTTNLNELREIFRETKDDQERNPEIKKALEEKRATFTEAPKETKKETPAAPAVTAQVQIAPVAIEDDEEENTPRFLTKELDENKNETGNDVDLEKLLNECKTAEDVRSIGMRYIAYYNSNKVFQEFLTRKGKDLTIK